MTAAVDPTGEGSGARWRERLTTLAAFTAPLSLYLFTATRTIQGGDTPEFALVAARGGSAHPPGYPLYSLLVYLAARLPLGTPAFAAALVSALAGAGTVALLERCLRRLTARRSSALLGALAYGVSPLAWKLAGEPEVFTLGTCLAAALLLAVLRLRVAPPTRMARAAALVGLVFGLGVANHHTIVLCAPLLVWAALEAARRLRSPEAGAGRRRAIAWALAASAGLIVGLLPYGYLLVAARGAGRGAWAWGGVDGPAALVRHFLRREYGTFSLMLGDFERHPWRQIGHCLGRLPAELFFVFFGLAVWGIGVLLRRDRAAAIAVLACFALAGIVLPAAFDFPPSPLSAAVEERFFLLPTFLFAVFAGVGLEAAARRLSPQITLAAAAAALLLAAATSLGGADWHRDATIERYLTAALASAAPGAVVLGEGDLEVCGFRYLGEVRGVRPDVRYVDVHLVRLRWYHELVQREVPELGGVPYDARTTPLRRMLATLAAQVPTYVTAELAPKVAGVPVYPEGFLLRVAAAPAPAPAELERGVEEALARMLPLPAPVDAWAAHARRLAAEPFALLARAYERQGERAGAERCQGRAAALASDEALPALPVATAR
jgi:hypothetical protein